MPGCVQPVSVNRNVIASFVIDNFGSLAGGTAPSVALTRPIVTLSATETAAAGSATGLSLSNVG